MTRKNRTAMERLSRKKKEQLFRLRKEYPLLQGHIAEQVENVKTIENSLQYIRQQEAEQQKKEESRMTPEQNSFVRIERGSYHRQSRILELQIRNEKNLLVILNRLESASEQFEKTASEQQKADLLNLMFTLDEARRNNRNTAAALEREAENSEKIHELELELNRQPLTEKQRKHKTDELERRRKEEFEILEVERKQVEQQDRKLEKEELAQFLDDNQKVGELEHSLAEDKNVLRMMNSQLRREIFGNATVKADKALLSKVVDQMKNNPELKEKDQDELWNIMEAVTIYGQLHVTSHEYENGRKKELQYEQLIAGYVYQHLTKLVDRMNERDEAANQSPLKDKTYTDEKCRYAAVNLLNYFDAHLNGCLGMVPEEPENPSALHIVYRGYIKSPAADEKILKNDAEKAAEKDENANLADQKVEEDHRNAPLFPHEPCVQDLKQGALGDCYFISVLGEIAQTHPDRIREMIRDNHDGTATVRFFQKKENVYEPFYVTVDRVMRRGQTRYCEWAETIERALAASGLCRSKKANHEKYGRETGADLVPVPANIDQIYTNIRKGLIPGNPDQYPWLYDETGHLQKWEPSLDDLNSGTAKFSFEVLLGSNAEIRDIAVNENANQYWTDLDLSRKRYLSLTSAYTDDQLRIYNEIRSELERGTSITASAGISRTAENKTSAGIDHRHCYSVLGVREKKIQTNAGTFTRKYVEIRNPHAGIGRRYKLAQDETEVMVLADYNRTDGISMMDLQDFCTEMERITTAQAEPSPQERTRKICLEEEQVLEAYGKAMKEVGSWLDQIPFRLNSGCYRSLRSAVNAMKTPADSYDELQSQMDHLAKTLKAYKEHVGADTENTAYYRPQKMKAVRVLEHILQASANGYLSPQTYFIRRHADELIEKLSDEAYTDQKHAGELANVKNLIRTDRKKARENLLKSAYMQNWIGSRTILEMNEPAGSLKGERQKLYAAIISDTSPREMKKLGDVMDPKKIADTLEQAKQKFKGLH